MINILRSKKGMTLMELLVAMMVLSILIPVVTVCIFSTMRQYSWTKSYADMCGVVSVIDGTVQRELSLASGNMQVENGAVSYTKNGVQPQKMETLPSEAGSSQSILYINDTAILDVAFYKDVSVTAEFELLPDDAVKVMLTYDGVSTFVSTFIVERISAS